jgi:hypothetical protein
MNTYATSIFHIYNGCMSNFLFHYGDALQVGILLTRMRLFSPLLSLCEKDKNARDAEKNMLYMVLSLCSISIVTRLVIICSIPYFLFYYSFSGSLTLMVVFITIYTLVPTVSIFIFYSFNKIYREEFNRILFSRNFFYSKTFAILPPPFRNRYLTINFSFPIRKCIN